MGARPGGTPERPAVFFDDAVDFEDWLERHHDSASHLWVGFFKRHVAPRGLTYSDALVEALRYGWIDSVTQRIDDDAVRQRWTPRRGGSAWSAANVAHVERLLANGRMTPAGLAAFEARRTDPQGGHARDHAEAGRFPEPYLARWRAEPVAARVFFEIATPGYRKQCILWVLSAKREATRERRMGQLVAACAAGELVPPMRYGEPPAWLATAAQVAAEADPGGQRR